MLSFFKSKMGMLTAFMVFLLVPLAVFAQTATPAPDPSLDFATLFIQSLTNFGGLSAVAKVSTVIMLLVASMKVNLINSLLWDKVPDSVKKFVGPVLGALAGLAALYLTGKPVTLQDLSVWVLAGAGAPILHELLDAAKLIPGIGPTYVAVINLVEGFLDQKKTTT